MIAEVDPVELHRWRQDPSRQAPLVVDVREPWEFEYCRIGDSQSTPLNALAAELGALPRDRDIVLVCHHGVRSMQAAAWLRQSGFPRVHNLRGGIAAWAAEVEPAMKRY